MTQEIYAAELNVRLSPEWDVYSSFREEFYDYSKWERFGENGLQRVFGEEHDVLGIIPSTDGRMFIWTFDAGDGDERFDSCGVYPDKVDAVEALFYWLWRVKAFQYEAKSADGYEFVTIPHEFDDLYDESVYG